MELQWHTVIVKLLAYPLLHHQLLLDARARRLCGQLRDFHRHSICLLLDVLNLLHIISTVLCRALILSSSAWCEKHLMIVLESTSWTGLLRLPHHGWLLFGRATMTSRFYCIWHLGRYIRRLLWHTSLLWVIVFYVFLRDLLGIDHLLLLHLRLRMYYRTVFVFFLFVIFNNVLQIRIWVWHTMHEECLFLLLWGRFRRWIGWDSPLLIPLRGCIDTHNPVSPPASFAQTCLWLVLFLL